MRSSTIMALSAFTLALSSSAAWADGAAPAAVKTAKGTYIMEEQHISLRAPRPHVTVDINRLVPRAPLPELRAALVERIGAAVEKDPF
jgi:hypothetical protein